MLPTTLTEILDQTTVSEHEVVLCGQSVPRTELARACYGLLHAGHTDPVLTPRRDHGLERRLTEAVPHPTANATVVFRGELDGDWLVEWDGVLVRLPHSGPCPAPDTTVSVAVPPVRPLLSPGFLVATGSRATGDDEPMVRVYVHLRSAGHAPAIWARTLDVAEAAGGNYQAKVLSRSWSYPRRDALVLYLAESRAGLADDLARALAGMPGLGEETSLLAERRGPGVALAWEPVDDRPGMTGLSFGQHRSRVLAAAVLAGEGPAAERVVTAFRAARINPANPARNLP